MATSFKSPFVFKLVYHWFLTKCHFTKRDEGPGFSENNYFLRRNQISPVQQNVRILNLPASFYTLKRFHKSCIAYFLEHAEISKFPLEETFICYV